MNYFPENTSISSQPSGSGFQRNPSARIRAGIIGGAGYTGSELIRLLLHHDMVEINFIYSKSQAGKHVSEIHPDLTGDTDLVFSSDTSILNEKILDILFLCVAHGEAKRFLDQHPLPEHTRIIDLSQDFRLFGHSQLNNRKFVYGLPELNKEAIREAWNIANPGCFATAIQLGLLPIAKKGLLPEVYTTGITGSTGAGQALSATSHFSWRAGNIQAYKTLNHQHLNEICQTINLLQPGFQITGQNNIHFVPWRGDFTRGIFVSSVFTCGLEWQELMDLYKDFYKDQPFTIVASHDIFLKQVINTNKCVIQLEKSGNKLAVHSALDNLLKGASGQAVQNMNLMFGFREKSGLELKSTAF